MIAVSKQSESNVSGSPATPPFGMIVNFVLFYAGWFACVLGLAWGWGWMGPLSAAVIVAVHLALRRSRRSEALAIAVVALLGPWVEGALALLGVARFGNPLDSFWVAMPSLVGLWAVFATTFDASLGWLTPRPLLAVVFAAIGVPLTYYGAGELGAVTLDENPWRWLVPVVLLWVVAFPGFLRLSAWIRHRFEPSAIP